MVGRWGVRVGVALLLALCACLVHPAFSRGRPAACTKSRSFRSAMKEAQRHDEAMNDLASIQCWQAALRLAATQDERAEAHHGLGVALYIHDGEQSVSNFQKSVELATTEKKRIGYRVGLGNALVRVRRFTSAIEHLEAARAAEPSQMYILFNLGTAYTEVGRLRDARDALQTYLGKQGRKKQPDAMAGSQRLVHAMLGRVLRDLGDLQDAKKHLRKAVKLAGIKATTQGTTGKAKSPPSPEQVRRLEQMGRGNDMDAALLNDLGTTYILLKEHEKALRALERAVELNPSGTDAYVNVAQTHSELKDHRSAAEWFRRAFRVRDPKTGKAGKKVSGRLSSYMHELQCLGDWSSYFENMAELRKLVANERAERVREEKERVEKQEERSRKRFGSLMIGPLTALLLPFNGRETRDITRDYAQMLLSDFPDLVPYTTWPLAERIAPRRSVGKGINNDDDGDDDASGSGSDNDNENDNRLVVAYVGANLGHHVAASTIQGVFAAHDAKRFKIVVASISADDGSPTFKRVRREAPVFLDLEGLGYEEQAKRIRDTGAHVVIDLDGYTQGTRREIFEMRPGPVQGVLMGYVGTAGSTAIDFTVADASIAPAHLTTPGAQMMTERALFMPNSYFVNDYNASFSDQVGKAASMDLDARRVEIGLPARGDATVFCNFNRHRKFDPVIFGAWMHILRRVPGSVLWLLDFDGGKDFFGGIATDYGIDPDRLIFSPRFPQEEHLAVKSVCDLFLDNPVYNAHTTGTDALWAGVPVLTLPLDRMASRVGVSLITAVGCSEGLVAGSLAEYINLAVSIGLVRGLAARHRACVEKGRSASPLFDLRRWVSDFETLLMATWEVYVATGHKWHVVSAKH